MYRNNVFRAPDDVSSDEEDTSTSDNANAGVDDYEIASQNRRRPMPRSYNMLPPVQLPTSVSTNSPSFSLR